MAAAKTRVRDNGSDGGVEAEARMEDEDVWVRGIDQTGGGYHVYVPIIPIIRRAGECSVVVGCAKFVSHADAHEISP